MRTTLTDHTEVDTTHFTAELKFREILIVVQDIEVKL